MKKIIFSSPADLEKSLLDVSSGLAITKGNYTFPPNCSVDDLDWNHMDWDHRPKIHNTYTNSVRLYAEPNFALSLTQMNFLGIKVFIQVSDIKLDKGLFYQCYTLFGLIYIHGVLENKEDSTNFTWYIMSAWWLKAFHHILSKKLFKLNKDQINEDVPLRNRRFELRKAGYDFKNSKRNYVTSNDKQMNTLYPSIEGSHRVDLSLMPENQMTEVKFGQHEFFILKNNLAAVELWPKVCPHEGGPLDAKNYCGKSGVECPWHGYKIKPVIISANPVTFYGGTFFIRNNTLLINS